MFNGDTTKIYYKMLGNVTFTYVKSANRNIKMILNMLRAIVSMRSLTCQCAVRVEYLVLVLNKQIKAVRVE